MLEDIFGSKVGVKILLHVGRSPYKEFYLNELSKNLGVGLGRTATLLEILAREDVMTRKKSGNRLLYRLNRNNPLAFEIIRFANQNALTGLPEKFRTAIVNFTKNYRDILGDDLVSVVIFGSVSKGRTTDLSDIDIFVLTREKIGKRTKKKMEAIFSGVSAVFSQTTEEHVFSVEQFRKDYETGDDFLINVMRDGILVYDKNDFFGGFLLKGLPEITKASVEKRLKIAKEWLDSSAEMFKKYPNIASQLAPAAVHLSRALLMLNRVMPESKHDIPGQLKSIGENKFSEVYTKTREWWDNPPLDTDKDELWEILSFLREKYNECRKKLEGWA